MHRVRTSVKSCFAADVHWFTYTRERTDATRHPHAPFTGRKHLARPVRVMYTVLTEDCTAYCSQAPTGTTIRSIHTWFTHRWGAASIRISQWPTSLHPPLHTHTHTHAHRTLVHRTRVSIYVLGLHVLCLTWSIHFIRSVSATI